MKTLIVDDASAIRELADEFVEAFNAHDATAFAKTFAKDAYFSNVRGEGASGRDNIARFNEPIFRRLFAEAKFTYSVRRIRFLADDIAGVDLDWEITGSKDTDGDTVELRKGRIDWIVTREKEGWLIKIMHNRQASPCLQ